MAQRPSHSCQGRTASMLPGFRFLFAAIMLSMSLLIFGLGAAALLRAAHEEFASNPSWRATPEVTFAQRADATGPVLATLRVDMPAAQKTRDETPAIAAPAEQAAIAPQPAAPEPIPALKPEESSPPQAARAEAAKPEVPVAENPGANDAAPASPEKTGELKIAAIATSEVAPGDARPVSAMPESTGAQIVPEAAVAKVATLGGPPVEIKTPPPAKVSEAKPDESAIKKRQEARRAAHRRRLAAARAQLAVQAQQQANPFFQPPPAVHARQ